MFVRNVSTYETTLCHNPEMSVKFLVLWKHHPISLCKPESLICLTHYSTVKQIEKKIVDFCGSYSTFD